MIKIFSGSTEQQVVIDIVDSTNSHFSIMATFLVSANSLYIHSNVNLSTMANSLRGQQSQQLLPTAKITS